MTIFYIIVKIIISISRVYVIIIKSNDACRILRTLFGIE